MRRKMSDGALGLPKGQDVRTYVLDLLTVVSELALGAGFMVMIVVRLGSARSRELCQSMNSG